MRPTLPPRPPPVTVRLSRAEHAALVALAASRSVGFRALARSIIASVVLPNGDTTLPASLPSGDTDSREQT